MLGDACARSMGEEESGFSLDVMAATWLTTLFCARQGDWSKSKAVEAGNARMEQSKSNVMQFIHNLNRNEGKDQSHKRSTTFAQACAFTARSRWSLAQLLLAPQVSLFTSNTCKLAQSSPVLTRGMIMPLQISSGLGQKWIIYRCLQI